MSDDDDIIEATTDEQRRVLTIVFVLNVALSIALFFGGVIADSSGLMANALDNTSDAAVYALSLFAIGRSRGWKRAAAAASGLLLILFAFGVLADTGRRVLFGSEPIGTTMMWLAAAAAIVNAICMVLLARLRTRDVNVEAARTFSFNDLASNGGILVSGALVAWLGARWPDLVAGGIVAAIALKGGIEILSKARRPESGSL